MSYRCLYKFNSDANVAREREDDVMFSSSSHPRLFSSGLTMMNHSFHPSKYRIIGVVESSNRQQQQQLFSLLTQEYVQQLWFFRIFLFIEFANADENVGPTLVFFPRFFKFLYSIVTEFYSTNEFRCVICYLMSFFQRGRERRVDFEIYFQPHTSISSCFVFLSWLRLRPHTRRHAATFESQLR